MWSSHSSVVSVQGGDSGIPYLLLFRAKRFWLWPEVFIEDLRQRPWTFRRKGSVEPLRGTLRAHNLPGLGEFLQGDRCEAGGIVEDVLNLMALGGNEAFPLDAAGRYLPPPCDEMRQERPKAMPEQMLLLAGDTLYFLDQI